MVSQRGHRFGGGWTEEKLDRVSLYLQAYTTALKNQPFALMYADAFAGTGYRLSTDDTSTVGGLFQMPEVDDLAKGSARLALEVDPPFDQYVFIEKNRKRFAALQELSSEFPERRDRIQCVNKEANDAIVELCRNTDWQRTRAVMFLDPHGMQVDWSTIEVIAGTQSIDLWYLFPVGMGVNRLTTRDGDIPKAWQDALDRMLGYREWRDDFYVEVPQPDLFGDAASTRKKDTGVEKIEASFLNRMRQIFAGVAERGLRLSNSRGQCMYLLLFASGNPKGAPIALNIAQHILKP